MSARIRNELAAFCAWWLHELRDIGEALLIRIAPRLATRVLVDFSASGGSIVVLRGSQPQEELRFSFDEPFQLPAPVAGARAMLALSADEVLVHRLRFPQAVKSELNSAIALHLERELPLPLEQVCLFHRICAHEPARRQIEVEIFVARHNRVDELRRLAVQWGLRPTQIGLRSHSTAVVGNFLAQRGRFERLSLTPLDRRLAGAAAGLLIAVGSLIAGQWIYERVSVGKEMGRASEMARTVERLEQNLGRDSAPAIALLRVSATADAADALTGLTEAIAPDSWAYQLKVSAPPAVTAQIALSGFAPAATMLTDALERSPHFENVRLVSAVSAGLGTGQDRLELTAEWRAE